MYKIIGIISDTHRLLRPEVIEQLNGVDMILHAGDIVDNNIIISLQKIAPVYAVRGNCDTDSSTSKYPKTEYIELGNTRIYLLHNLNELDIVPKTLGINVIISGHTHQPKVEEKGGILYINPGSCGPRRFSLPISIAIMDIDNSKCEVKLLDLEHNKQLASHTAKW